MLSIWSGPKFAVWERVNKMANIALLYSIVTAFWLSRNIRIIKRNEAFLHLGFSSSKSLRQEQDKLSTDLTESKCFHAVILYSFS